MTNPHHIDQPMGIGAIEHLFDRLWGLSRSLTGNGVRQSFEIVHEHIPYDIHEMASGEEVFDWTVPLEWNVRDAWLETPDGRRIARFTDNNLHLMGYSEPMDQTLPWSELTSHLYIDNNMPNAIPYRTSYYKRNWGFCLTKNEYDPLSAVTSIDTVDRVDNCMEGMRARFNRLSSTSIPHSE